MLPLFTYNSDPPLLITTEVHQTPQQSGAREFHASFSSCGFCPFPPNHLALPTVLALLQVKLEQKVGRAQNAERSRPNGEVSQNLDRVGVCRQARKERGKRATIEPKSFSSSCCTDYHIEC
eukprot:scaffold13168_cov66-Cyclotella_meneghiniana.AAC.5